METTARHIDVTTEPITGSSRIGRVWGMLRDSMRSGVGYAGGTTTSEDASAVRALLRSGSSLQEGPHIDRFQSALVAYLGTRHATTYGAARMALFALLKAMKLSEGDEVILPGYNCIVIPNAIRFAGLIPIYVDIREADLNLDPDLVERAITSRTRAIIVQHSFGVPADMDALIGICAKHGLPLLEDCAHAFGAEWDGKKLGTFGHAGFFSTEATKMFSTEKGGILVTDDVALDARVREIHASLPFRDAAYESLMARRFMLRRWTERAALKLPFTMLRILDLKLGFRRLERVERYDADDYRAELSGRRAEPYPCRLSNVMSCAGLGQLNRIEADLAHRRTLARHLEQILPDHGARVLSYDARRAKPSWVRFPFLVDDPADWESRLAAAGLERGHWLNDPCHPRGSNYEFAMYRRGSCPVAERISQRIFNVPVHSGVSEERIRRLDRTLRED